MNSRIKQLRKKLELKQQEFADEINLSRSMLSCYENGTYDVPERSAKQICDKFNVNPEWLFKGVGDMFLPEPEVDELSLLMGMFNPEEDEFKTKIITTLLKLEDNDWLTIKKIFNEMLK